MCLEDLKHQEKLTIDDILSKTIIQISQSWPKNQND